MFSDPINVVTALVGPPTPDGAGLDLPATSRAPDSSTYFFDDGGSPATQYTMFLSRQYKKRNRFSAKLTVNSIVPDVLVGGNSVPVSMSAYLVIDTPTVGFTKSEIEAYTLDLLQTLVQPTMVNRIISGET